MYYGKQWDRLSMIDIPPLVPKAIQGMYRTCRSSVRFAFGLGLCLWKLGSVLSALLFILLTDGVLKGAENDLLPVEEKVLRFAYADDIDLVTCYAQSSYLQKSLNVCNKMLTKNELQVKPNKSEKVRCYISRYEKVPDWLHIVVSCKELKQVESFRYVRKYNLFSQRNSSWLKNWSVWSVWQSYQLAVSIAET